MHTHTLEVTGIPDDLLKRLDERVKRRGGDRSASIRELVERGLQAEDRTLAEILAPVHAYSRQMGQTEEEIGEFVDEEIAAYRAERRARREKESTANG